MAEAGAPPGAEARRVRQRCRPIRTRPAITGTAKAGKTLTCSSGTWTNTPTGYAYQWSRDGTPIQGARARTYVVQKSDEQLTLICTVTASNAKGAGASASSTGLPIAVPIVKGCPKATGRLSGTTAGPDQDRGQPCPGPAGLPSQHQSRQETSGLLLSDPDRDPGQLRFPRRLQEAP